MNRRELVAAIADTSGLETNAADAALTACLAAIGDALAAGESVTLPGFGTFEVRSRAEREGRNPQTGEPLTIPAGRTPAFKPATALKHAVKTGENG